MKGGLADEFRNEDEEILDLEMRADISQVYLEFTHLFQEFTRAVRSLKRLLGAEVLRQANVPLEAILGEDYSDDEDEEKKKNDDKKKDEDKKDEDKKDEDKKDEKEEEQPSTSSAGQKDLVKYDDDVEYLDDLNDPDDDDDDDNDEEEEEGAEEEEKGSDKEKAESTKDDN